MTEIMKRGNSSSYWTSCARFGQGWLAWAFVYPRCGDVAAGQDRHRRDAS